MSETITYEQPLNERIRILLRLESLFRNIQETLDDPNPASSHATLERLNEILTLTERSELKKDLMKELDRNHLTLSALREHPGIDHQQLDSYLNQISQLNRDLDSDRGKPGQDLRDSEFMKNFRQRSGVPGGLSDIDFPLYHFWLNLPPQQRTESLRGWVESFDTVRDAVSLVLNMVRRSKPATTATAVSGYYQQSLDKDIPYQMIRITLPIDTPFYVEISAGRHRFTARMMIPDLVDRPAQTDQDVSFELTTCVL